MKKISILFVGLLITFLGLWAVKAKTPTERPDAYLHGVDDTDGAWWLSVSTESSEIASGGELDPELPSNYIPLLGYKETYMVIGENGAIEEYRQRTRQDDGSWLWQTVDPNIPEYYEAVPGLENVYKVTEKDGRVHYLKYIRNEDSTFCFIDVDEEGQLLNKSDSENRENSTENLSEPEKDTTTNTLSPKPPSEQEKIRPSENDVTIHTPDIIQKPSADGGYTETETIYDTKISGNWKITYQTVVTRTYDVTGRLLRTKKDGPIEVSKKPVNGMEEKAPDRGKIAATLDQEYRRVTSDLKLNPDLAQNVLNLLNIERQTEQLPPLKMELGSDAYKLACIKAADMAIYNHADFDSPMYGTIAELLSRYQIASNGPSETLWKTAADKAAKDIHIRFQSQEISRSARMQRTALDIGIAIVEKNGYYFIAEIFY